MILSVLTVLAGLVMIKAEVRVLVCTDIGAGGQRSTTRPATMYRNKSSSKMPEVQARADAVQLG